MATCAGTCVLHTYSTCQTQGITCFTCETRVVQVQHVRSKYKTCMLRLQNACGPSTKHIRNMFIPTAKHTLSACKTCLLQVLNVCAPHTKQVIHCTRWVYFSHVGIHLFISQGLPSIYPYYKAYLCCKSSRQCLSLPSPAVGSDRL